MVPTHTLTDYLIPLDDPACADPALAGTKAATLASLVAAGFPVPEGIVLTTEAFHPLAGEPEAGEVTSRRARLPEWVERAIIQAADRFGNAPLAVRSSGVAEDLDDASFAGQYDSVLGVRGAEELVEAVERCWASASSGFLLRYREQVGKDGSAAPMAVLIQRLVDAETAGVAFTADPVSGDRSTTVIEAVRGLSNRALAGEVTPERWSVAGDGTAQRQGGVSGVLEPTKVQKIARLARQIGAHLGRPQDVEWAVAEGQVWVVQARPITSLAQRTAAAPVPVDVPAGFWEREISHFPRPLSPFHRSFLLGLQNDALHRTFEEMGGLLETLEYREIGGWVYSRLVPLGGKDLPPPPAWVLGLMARLMPAMRRRVRAAQTAIESDKPITYIRRWSEKWRQELATEAARLRDVDRPALSDEALDRHLGETAAFAARALDIHFLLHGAIMQPTFELAVACQELLGWEENRLWDLLSGASSTSTLPVRRLEELASRAHAKPELRLLVDRPSPDTLARVEELDPEFASALAAYRLEFGSRAMRQEVAEPTLRERPELLLRLISDQIAAAFNSEEVAGETRRRRTAALEEADRILASRSDAERRRFQDALARAQEAYPVREDNERYTVSAPIALARFAALEVGRRLSQRVQIERADDVFFLEAPEARASLRDGQDRRVLVRRRKAERAWAETHTGPPTYGREPAPPPSLRALPEAARRMNEALLWYADATIASEKSGLAQDPAAGRLLGIAASSGRYTGTVRVIMGEGEFDKLERGDVVVCPVTSPAWSVVFPSIGALVTDSGGILSHPAIIAREFMIPAVVATGNATSLLRDGQQVTVDGTAGVVEIS
jgi:rifampicin phosphotransferase